MWEEAHWTGLRHFLRVCIKMRERWTDNYQKCIFIKWAFTKWNIIKYIFDYCRLIQHTTNEKMQGFYGFQWAIINFWVFINVERLYRVFLMTFRLPLKKKLRGFYALWSRIGGIICSFRRVFPLAYIFHFIFIEAEVQP